MIAVDPSAIVAIIVGEPEQSAFRQIMAAGEVVVGAPTLVETRLVLESRLPDAVGALRLFLQVSGVSVVPFDAAMFEAAIEAFARFGKGRAHPANLNFGDCLSYAVARTRALPLLFKGSDFVHTDIVPAYLPAP